MLKIATWNVNSIRARKERVLSWLSENPVDVLCMQELKGTEEAFPSGEFAELGYRGPVVGQKTYNGVAIMSRLPVEDPLLGLGGGADEQARLVAALTGGVRVVCVYVPNGKAVGTDKYDYKLGWMARLGDFLRHYAPTDPLVLCGDFNVAPEDRDVYDPAAWEGQILCSDAEREALAALVDWGLEDVFRRHHSDGGLYTWWDYRMLGFPKNRGLRIDHIYATRPLAERCTEAIVDREARKGQKPSDHAPVIATFDVDAAV